MSDIDSQTHAFHQLYAQHQSTRREYQQTLIESLENLKFDAEKSLANDRRTYEAAKIQFREKFTFIDRLLKSEPSNYYTTSIRPLKEKFQRRTNLVEKINVLYKETRDELNPMEIRSEWNGSVAVAFHPITGRAEWRTFRSGGIHGVYNPTTRSIEWESELHTGVYGVFNPQLNIVEWKKSLNGGVHGVYNPVKKTVEWFISFNSGVGGVFNPLTNEVEWKTSFKGGVIGYFDQQTETVKWIEKWHHGLAMILWDPVNRTYLTTASCGWHNQE